MSRCGISPGLLKYGLPCAPHMHDGPSIQASNGGFQPDVSIRGLGILHEKHAHDVAPVQPVPLLMAAPISPFEPFLTANGFVVLDGGLATELEAQVHRVSVV